MKTILATLIIIISGVTYSQPGCLPESSITKTFIDLSNRIANEPTNFSLVWERMNYYYMPCDNNIIFNKEQKKLIEYSKDSSTVSYKMNFINELSLLIDKDFIIEFSHYEKAEKNDIIYYRRGKEYLINKDTINALKDFNAALSTSDPNLKIDVIEALSNYYFSLRKSHHCVYKKDKENSLKALAYLDLVSTINFPNSLSRNEKEHFIIFKKKILYYLKDYSRLEKYQLKIIEYTYHSAPTYDKYQINGNKENVINQISELAYLYFNHFKDYQKSKKIIELVLQYIPDDKYNYVYNRSFKQASKYGLLSKIYQTSDFKNKDLELHFLMKRLYADPMFNNYDLGTEYLDKIMKLHPKDSRVYLAWVYIKIMDECIRKKNRIVKSYPLSIPDLFSKVEGLNYKGFELPFLKASYYFRIKELNQALFEINNALKIYKGAKLLSLKRNILQSLKYPDYEKVEQMKKENQKDYYEFKDLSKLINSVKDIANR